MQAMPRAAIDRPFLAQCLREWSLFRAIALELLWQPDDLLASSNWLQLMTAVGTHTEAARDPRRSMSHQADPQRRAGHPQSPQAELKNQTTRHS
ncbi:hypothetical protein [Streptomyces sp. C10-9-1]|uniref:hypothetical protein n=1 Tax=Streptomyces sp. C10-9-1 TaxID=1859285 RepID=UPI003D72766F